MPASDHAATTAVSDWRAGVRDQQSLPAVLLLATVSAAAFLLAFPPTSFWPLLFLWLTPLALISVMARSARWAVSVVYLTQVLMWLIANRWLIPVTVPGYIGLALYHSIYPAAFVMLLRYIERRGISRQIPLALLVPVLWVAVEFVRGHIFGDGDPWMLSMHPVIDWLAFSQSADLLGPYLPGALIAAVNGMLADLLLTSTRRAAGVHLRSKPVMAVALITAACIAVNLSYGWWRLSQDEPLQEGPRVLAVQTNLPQSNKTSWTAQQQQRDLPRFMELTMDGLAAAGGDADLVVWPETMIPGIGFDPQARAVLANEHDGLWSDLRRWPDIIEQFASNLEVPMLVGSPTWLDVNFERFTNEQGEAMIRIAPGRQYNSAYLLGGDEPMQRYDKYSLTPFGETMPYISHWPWLEEQLLAFGAAGMAFDLDAGDRLSALRLPVDHDQTIHIATPICFEDLVAPVVRQMVYRGGAKRVDLLINISNDGWFSDSDYGRAIHAIGARFRTIENRVPMIRAANTGYSLAIDSRGKVVDVIGDGRYGTARQAGTLLTAPMLDSRRTLYSRVGEVLPWLCLTAAGLLLVLSFRACRKKRTPAS